MCYLNIINLHVCLAIKKKKKTLTELPKQKPNKVLNTRDRANIIKYFLHGLFMRRDIYIYIYTYIYIYIYISTAGTGCYTKSILSGV